MSEVHRLLILSPNWLGDAVMALPAIADIRRHFPTARLIVAARPAVARMFPLAPSVDDVLTLEWRGRLLRPRGWNDDVAAVRQAGCDAAILLPNSFAAAWLTLRAGIVNRWGYATDLRRFLLTRSVHTPAGSLHQAAYYQHLTQALGIPAGPREAVLTVPRSHVDAARHLLTGVGWDGARPLVAIAPGAAYGTAKRWMPSHFARLVTLLMTDRGAQCVLIGSKADAETTGWIRALVGVETRVPLLDLAGATTLETLAGLLTLVRVCVSNDSGAMHLAAAVGAPVAALFGPTRERETAPVVRAGGRAEVLINAVWCRPCMLRECPIDHRCMKGLAPERVFATVSELMRSSERTDA